MSRASVRAVRLSLHHPAQGRQVYCARFGGVRMVTIGVLRRLAGPAAAAALALGFVLQLPASRVSAQGEDALDVVKVRKNFYMIAGAGGNIGVQIGSDGVVLVNAGTAQASDRVLGELKKLTDLP